MTNKLTIIDGYIYKIVTLETAISLIDGDILNVYAIYQDGTESLLTEADEARAANRNGLDLGVDVGRIDGEHTQIDAADVDAIESEESTLDTIIQCGAISRHFPQACALMMAAKEAIRGSINN